MLLSAVLIGACAHRPLPPAGVDRPLPIADPVDPSIVAALAPLGVSLDEAAQEHAIDAVVVLHEGALVFERYYHGHAVDTPHDLRSATKSITALLVGIAIDRGALPGTDVAVMDVLRTQYPRVTDKDTITVGHLLNMAPGLDCDDGDRQTAGQEDRVYRTRDWTATFLNLDVVAPPGGPPRYCTAGVVALGEVLARATGQDVADFAQEVLFGPLGIENLRWARYDGGAKVDTGGHLALTARGLAQLGQLLIEGGRNDGRQIVPAAWIDVLWTPTAQLHGNDYGHLWYRDVIPVGDRRYTVHSARGNGGQALFVVPELDLVVAAQASWYNRPEVRAVYHMVYAGILPAIALR